MIVMNEIQVMRLPIEEIINTKKIEIENNGYLSLHQRLDFYIETLTRT
jgi:hypothetical protein